MACTPADSVQCSLQSINERLDALVGPLQKLAEPTLADWLSAGGTLLAAAIAVFAAVQNLRAKKRNDAETINAAEQGARSFNEAEVLKTVVEQIEKLKLVGEERATLVLRPGTKPNSHVIANDGPASAYEVFVQGRSKEDERDLIIPVSEVDELEPGATIPFSIDRSLVSGPVTTIVVGWRDGRDRATHRRTRFIVS